MSSESAGAHPRHLPLLLPPLLTTRAPPHPPPLRTGRKASIRRAFEDRGTPRPPLRPTRGYTATTPCTARAWCPRCSAVPAVLRWGQHGCVFVPPLPSTPGALPTPARLASSALLAGPPARPSALARARPCPWCPRCSAVPEVLGWGQHGCVLVPPFPSTPRALPTL